LERATSIATLAALSLCSLLLLAHIYEFSQTRFFTVDEYHYGHATWLVSQGQRPYLDFFEHHFPLSYVLHAPLFGGDESFTEKALLLRKISFAYILAASLVLGISGWLTTRNPYVGLLSTMLPPAFGFSLMSLVDYRADLFGSILFLCAVALLELNRDRDRRWLAALSGVLLVGSLFMTQKMVVLAGGVVGALWLADRLRALRLWERIAVVPEPRGPRFVQRPWTLVLTGAAGVCLVLGVGLFLGLLPKAFEITVRQALAHEQFHHFESVLLYVGYFWETTWISTLAIALFAVVYLVLGGDGFWKIAVPVALAAGLDIQAQHPYNYFAVCYLVVLCGIRGYAWAVERGSARLAKAQWAIPLLYLLPLALIPNQLSFIAHVSSNDYQLRLLQKIEDYSDEDDAVIDNAGGAMFRKHGSYYFVHGAPHRLLFAEYFRKQLVRDYRESRALFWIHDFRFKKLPEVVQRYLNRQYLRVDGDLRVLGFYTPATVGIPHRRGISVVREDDYYIHRYETREGQLPGSDGLLIDSQPVAGDRIHLEERNYAIEAKPNSPAYILSPVPREFFDDPTIPNEYPEYSRIFEYDPYRSRSGSRLLKPRVRAEEGTSE